MSVYRITVGYYNETETYCIEANNKFEAEEKALKLGRMNIHPKAEIFPGTKHMNEIKCPHCGKPIN
jgi:hypothetical protein